MSTKIKCPKCQNEFPLEAALTDELKEVIEREKEQLRKQMLDYKKAKEDELQKKDNEWQQKILSEKKQLQEQIEVQIRKSVTTDYEHKLQLLEKSQKENEEKLRTAQLKEADFLKKEIAIKNKEAELELTLQKKLTEERGKLAEELRRLELQRNEQKDIEHQLKVKELETQLEQQKKLAAEMQRKAEQGSMQLQGESQELALEGMLKEAFPFDLIAEVGKGVRGADSIQLVRNNLGAECGKIIWESKRAENFSNEWIEKLKADMRSQGADVAVLVTRRYPKDMDRFGEKNGVWICNFAEATAVASLIRDGLIKIFHATKSQENKGEKMAMLYNYLTSAEFAEQWKAIREGFLSMKISIQRERDAMERLWKSREKQLEKVLLNATHIRGSIDGISGLESVDLNLLDYNED